MDSAALEPVSVCLLQPAVISAARARIENSLWGRIKALDSTGKLVCEWAKSRSRRGTTLLDVVDSYSTYAYDHPQLSSAPPFFASLNPGLCEWRRGYRLPTRKINRTNAFVVVLKPCSRRPRFYGESHSKPLFAGILACIIREEFRSVPNKNFVGIAHFLFLEV